MTYSRLIGAGLLSGLACGFSPAAALADNNLIAAANQTGSGNSASVRQDGNALILGLMRQGGNDNQLKLTLSGSNLGGRYLTQGQTYDLANNAGMSYANGSQAVQEGNANTLDVSIASTNSSNLRGSYGMLQRGNGNTMRADARADESWIGLGQFGDRNAITALRLRGADIDIGIRQDGDDNTAAGRVEGTGMDSQLLSIGDRNRMSLTMAGNDGWGYVQLEGDDNTARLVQSGAFNLGSIVFLADEGTGTVLQDGIGNDGQIGAQGGAGNTLFLQQIGDGNSGGATVSYGTGNDFAVRQTGSDNQAMALSMGGNGNSARLAQNGAGNGVLVNLGLGAPLPPFMWREAEGNDVATSQRGNGNNINVNLLNANHNTVSVAQTGNANDAVVRIEGEHNLWRTRQTGNGNRLSGSAAGPLISGNGNSLVTLQNGDLNTISGSIAGNGNSVDIAQNGNANQASFAQVGGMNSLTVGQ